MHLFMYIYTHKASVLNIPEDPNETEGGARAKGVGGGCTGGLQEEQSRIR